jgi:hypothetical protein
MMHIRGTTFPSISLTFDRDNGTKLPVNVTELLELLVQPIQLHLISVNNKVNVAGFENVRSDQSYEHFEKQVPSFPQNYTEDHVSMVFSWICRGEKIVRRAIFKKQIFRNSANSILRNTVLTWQDKAPFPPKNLQEQYDKNRYQNKKKLVSKTVANKTSQHFLLQKGSSGGPRNLLISANRKNKKKKCEFENIKTQTTATQPQEHSPNEKIKQEDFCPACPLACWLSCVLVS